MSQHADHACNNCVMQRQSIISVSDAMPAILCSCCERFTRILRESLLRTSGDWDPLSACSIALREEAEGRKETPGHRTAAATSLEVP